MPGFHAAHAEAADWRSATDACLGALGATEPGANLGFVYLTDHVAPQARAVLDRLRAATGVEDWVGTVGIGIAANSPRSGANSPTAMEHFDRAAVAVLLGSFAARDYRVFQSVHGGARALQAEHGDWLRAARPQLGVVHADPRNPLAAEIVEGLAEETGAFLVGGLTSSRAGFPQIAERVVEGGVSGVLFAREVEVATGLSQGCAPIGPTHTVTDAEEKVVKTLDGRPALDVFKEEIGAALARNLRAVAGHIFVALPVAGSDTGDYLVRNLTAIDPAQGWIGIAAEIEDGDRLIFVHRDRTAAEADLRRMLDGLSRRLGDGRPIKAGVYHSCVARGPNLFGRDSEELKIIAERLGDFPLVGFFGNGEICNNRLYGYTGVLTLFL